MYLVISNRHYSLYCVADLCWPNTTLYWNKAVFSPGLLDTGILYTIITNKETPFVVMVTACHLPILSMYGSLVINCDIGARKKDSILLGK